MMLMLLGACPYVVDLDDTGVLTVELARLEIEAKGLDFGEVDVGEWSSLGTTVTNSGHAPVGLELTAVGDNDDAFCVHWQVTTPGCSWPVNADAKSDTGGGPSPRDTGTEPAPAAVCDDGSTSAVDAIVLEPGCSIAAVAVFSPTTPGPHLAGMRVNTVRNEATEAGGATAPDPRNFVQHVRLDGVGAGPPLAQRSLVADPPTVDFAWRWPDGGSELASFDLVNMGNVPLTLDAIDTSGCPEVAVSAEPGAGTVLAVGDRATVGLAYTAATPTSWRCWISATTAEGASASPGLAAALPSRDEAPTLSITAPTFAERIASTDVLEVSLDLADDLQPSSSLDVTVASLATGASVAGTPADDSGRASFLLPAGALSAGADTIIVSVTDVSGNKTKAAVPLRVDVEPSEDTDGDAWSVSEGDCDDADATAFPGAVETADAVDDDCDLVVDEGTTAYDDDGDGFTEADGDIDDGDAGNYPGGVESADRRDNDGDGLIDEGTSAYDDDGDGFSENDDDCHDSDPLVSPVATEVCDGKDTDCDGLNEDAEGLDCEEGLSLAYLDVTPDACTPGETVELELVGVGVSSLTWGTDQEWSADRFTATGELSVSMPCPDPEHSAGLLVTVFALAATAEGKQAWVDARLAAYPNADHLDYRDSIGEPKVVVTACNPTGAASVVGALGVVAIAAGVRRRRGGLPWLRFTFAA